MKVSVMEANKAISNFDSNIQSVRDLMNFDRFLMDYVIAHVEKASEEMLKVNEIQHKRYTLVGLLSSLKTIKSNESLRPKYQTIFNSCLVLAVAYFSSALDELFKGGLRDLIESGKDVSFGNEKIEFTIAELQQRDFNLKSGLEDLIAEKENTSWQDMQSVHRAFKKYFGIDIYPDKTMLNTIIAAQACRHVIVHSNGIVNNKTIGQLRNATPRAIKMEISKGQVIQFVPDEIEIVVSNMRQYLIRVSMDLESAQGA